MKTAFITGASEGIGLELARLFARDKINLILVGRNENKLSQIANELSGFNIQVDIYIKDLSIIKNAISVYNDIISKNLVIDYVVNCAGIGINKAYTDIPWEKELEMFNLNMITLAYFTKVFAAEMKLRKNGRILNVASAASSLSIPFMAGYSASKAFVTNLSQTINFELKGSGVFITTLCPGVTKTEFHTAAQSTNTLLSNKLLPLSTPAEVAKYGYRLMMKGKSYGIHGFLNNVYAIVNRFVSKNFQLSVFSLLLKRGNQNFK